MIRTVWAFALALVLVSLTGILIVTDDLSTTRDTFVEGVGEARALERTTDEANDGADQLEPGIASIAQGVPHVAKISGAMVEANRSLEAMARSLAELAGVLGSTDEPLRDVGSLATTARQGTSAAKAPIVEITQTLNSINQKSRTLGEQLDRTAVLAYTIDSKLRIALLIPRY